MTKHRRWGTMPSLVLILLAGVILLAPLAPRQAMAATTLDGGRVVTGAGGDDRTVELALRKRSKTRVIVLGTGAVVLIGVAGIRAAKGRREDDDRDT